MSNTALLPFQPEAMSPAQRSHVELYIRRLGESGLMPSSVNTSMHAVRGFFRFAHIDGLVPQRPGRVRATATSPALRGWTGSSSSVSSRSPRPSPCTTAPWPISSASTPYAPPTAVRIEDYQETLRGHRVLRLVGKRNKPATSP